MKHSIIKAANLRVCWWKGAIKFYFWARLLYTARAKLYNHFNHM